MYDLFSGCINWPAASLPMTSVVGKNTSNWVRPDASLAIASSMLVNVVTSTLASNSRWNFFRTLGAMYCS